MLGPVRRRLADAADLLRVLVGVAVGRGGVGRVRHLLEQRVALGLGVRELVLDRAQLLLDLVQLLELLRRRLALQLQPAAQLVDPRHQRAPALVGGEQRVEASAAPLRASAARKPAGSLRAARRSITRRSLERGSAAEQAEVSG